MNPAADSNAEEGSWALSFECWQSQADAGVCVTKCVSAQSSQCPCFLPSSNCREQMHLLNEEHGSACGTVRRAVMVETVGTFKDSRETCCEARRYCCRKLEAVQMIISCRLTWAWQPGRHLFESQGK
jgi:hypothetical protein